MSGRHTSGPDQNRWINIPTGMAESRVRMIRGKSSDVCGWTSPSCLGLVWISYVGSPTAARVLLDSTSPTWRIDY